MAIVSGDTTLSALSYAAAETIDITAGATLTIDSTPNVNPGHIRCILGTGLTGQGTLLIKNDGTTLSEPPVIVTLSANSKDFRFEVASTMQVRGQMVDLAAGDGSANQSWAFMGDWANIPCPSYVEVETAAGSGEFMPWFVFYEDTVAQAVSRTDFAGGGFEVGDVLFWSPANKTLTCGDGTNGNIIDTGRRVRVPNVFITSATTNNTNTARTQFDFNAGGTLDWENVCLDPERTYCNASGFASALVRNVGGCYLRFSNSNGFCHIDGASAVMDPLSTGNSLADIRVILGPSSIKRAVACNLQGVGLNVVQCFNLEEASNLRGAQFNRTATNQQSIQFQNIPASANIRDITAIGHRARLLNLAGNFFQNFKHADGFGTTQRTSTVSNAMYFVNAANCVVVGFSNAGPMATRDYLITSDAQSSNCSVFGVSYDGANNTTGLIEGNLAGFVCANGQLLNQRSGQRLVDCPTTFLSADYQITNFRSTSSGAVNNDANGGGQYNFITGIETGLLHLFTAAPNFAFANLVDPGLAPTQGTVACGPFGQADFITLEGGAAFDGVGGISLPITGNAAIMETSFDMQGITDFDAGGALRYDYTEGGVDAGNTATAPSGISFEFSLATPGGIFPFGYQPLTPANLSAALAALTGYDPNVGLNMRIKATATGDDATRVLNQVTMRTLVDSAFSAPDATFQLRGPQASDVTSLYRLDDDTLITDFTGPGQFNATFAGVLGLDAYWVRRNAAGVELMRTQSQPFVIGLGDLGVFDLFAGAEVQLAEAADIVLAQQESTNCLDLLPQTLSEYGDAAHVTPGTYGYVMNQAQPWHEADVAEHEETQAMLTNLSTDVNVVSVGGTSVAGPEDLKANNVVIDASAIADAVWDEAAADHVAAGSMGEAAQAPGFDLAAHHSSLDAYANKGDWMADAVTVDASAIAGAVQAGILDELDGQQVIDAIVQAIGNENVTAAAVAAEVWAYATRELTNPVDLTTLETKVGELALIHGLDLANPLTTTPTSRTAGTVTQELSGDGVTTQTLTRTA